jgi:CheY-like chemotaxis protein
MKNLFLVDDDTDDQEFFMEAIDKLENVTLSGLANNGKEALNKLKYSKTLPDYIFLDFNMPLMNGIECLAELKKMPLTKDIPVFMLSTAFEQAELSKKIGAKGFIKKSADIHGLETQLDCIINMNTSINYVITGETCFNKHPSFSQA